MNGCCDRFIRTARKVILRLFLFSIVVILTTMFSCYAFELSYVGVFALFFAILVVAAPQSLGPIVNGFVGCSMVNVLLVIGAVVIAVDVVVLLVMLLCSISLALVLLFLLVVGVAFFFGLLSL